MPETECTYVFRVVLRLFGPGEGQAKTCQAGLINQCLAPSSRNCFAIAVFYYIKKCPQRGRDMSDKLDEQLAEMIESLKQGRDELNLRMHLAKAEAKDLWQEMEDKWQLIRGQLDRIDNQSGDAAKDIGAATMVVAEEIRRGYNKLKDML